MKPNCILVLLLILNQIVCGMQDHSSISTAVFTSLLHMSLSAFDGLDLNIQGHMEKAEVKMLYEPARSISSVALYLTSLVGSHLCHASFMKMQLLLFRMNILRFRERNLAWEEPIH
jgi:hypothetical protein